MENNSFTNLNLNLNHISSYPALYSCRDKLPNAPSALGLFKYDPAMQIVWDEFPLVENTALEELHLFILRIVGTFGWISTRHIIDLVALHGSFAECDKKIVHSAINRLLHHHLLACFRFERSDHRNSNQLPSIHRFITLTAMGKHKLGQMGILTYSTSADVPTETLKIQKKVIASAFVVQWMKRANSLFSIFYIQRMLFSPSTKVRPLLSMGIPGGYRLYFEAVRRTPDGLNDIVNKLQRYLRIFAETSDKPLEGQIGLVCEDEAHARAVNHTLRENGIPMDGIVFSHDDKLFLPEPESEPDHAFYVFDDEGCTISLRPGR